MVGVLVGLLLRRSEAMSGLAVLSAVVNTILIAHLLSSVVTIGTISVAAISAIAISIPRPVASIPRPIATPSPVTADLTVSPVVSGLIGGVTAVSSPVLLGAIGISVSLSVAHTLLVSAVVRPVLIPILAITVTPVTILRRRLDRAD